MTIATPTNRSHFSRRRVSALLAVIGIIAIATVGATVRAADAPLTDVRPELPSSSTPLEVRQFNASGFAGKAVGVIYDAATVKQGVPLGGIGAGYLDFNADGTLGLCSIFNQFVPPRKLNRPFLGIVVDGQPRLVCLHAADAVAGAAGGRYWGHFPVADARGQSYALAWLAPAGTDTQLQQGVLRDWRQLDKPLAKADAADPSAAIAWDFTLSPGQSRSATAVLAWYQPHWKDSGGQPHTNMYSRRFAGSRAAVRFVAEHYDKLLRRTLAWQQAIYDDQRLPLWLREGLVNSLYPNVA